MRKEEEKRETGRREQGSEGRKTEREGRGGGGDGKYISGEGGKRQGEKARRRMTEFLRNQKSSRHRRSHRHVRRR